MKLTKKQLKFVKSFVHVNHGWVTDNIIVYLYSINMKTVSVKVVK